MEVKKNKHVNLERKRILFFEIGLILSLALLLSAFEWKSPQKKSGSFGSQHDKAEPILIIQNTYEKEKAPPEPPKPKLNLFTELNIKDNNELIDDVFDWIEPEEYSSYAIQAEFIEFEEVPDEPDFFYFAEKMPTYDGKPYDYFASYVMKLVNYPQIAIDNGIEGRVIVQFILDENGKMTHLKALSKADDSLIKEALRAVREAPPKWSPGIQGNQKVKVHLSIPLTFKLMH